MNYSGYYYSHQSLLAAAMTITKGSVLELGSGLGSTLMLHGLCGSMKRQLLTIESDEQWMLKFINYGRAWHQFRLVENYIDLPEYKQQWGLAFIDHGNTGDLNASLIRGHSVIELQDTPVLILHDTCWSFLYNYDEALKLFKYRWDWRVQHEECPQTTAVSKTINVSKIFAEFGL